MKRIFPSLLAGHISGILPAITTLTPFVDGFHLDIGDGVLVPHKWGSIALTREIQEFTTLPLWIHLMVQDPRTFIDRMTIRPQDIVSFHYESISSSPISAEIHNISTMINQRGGTASCAISPQTSIATALPHLITNTHLQHILLMTVIPGSSGQHLLPQSHQRYLQLRQYLEKNSNRRWTIGLDGGLNPTTVASFQLSDNNTELAIGSYIMCADDMIAATKKIRSELT